MSFTIKTGVGSLTSGISRASNQPTLPPSLLTVGKVYGVITTASTPTEKQFDRAGGFEGMGSVFFLDYNNAKNTVGNNTDPFLDSCDVAKPLFPNFSYYPLLGELIYILDLPSPSSQLTSKGTTQKYYITSINIWGSPQVNDLSPNLISPLGKTFVENPLIRNLLNFEGDFILQGRKGNSIRFGTTVRSVLSKNEWSAIGREGDPIMIISNYHKYSKDQDDYYVEKINEEGASIYLTSTQSIPLKINVKDPINPFTMPMFNFYTNPQVIINADRVVLNSKKDDVMIFAKSNIELSTTDIINLNAGEYIHLNVKEENPTQSTPLNLKPKIFLGTTFGNTFPSEPLLLGNQTKKYLLDLLKVLDIFSIKLTAAASTPQGSPLADVQAAAAELNTNLSRFYVNIEKLSSKSTYTI
jgi:hypothetical protein